MKYKIYKIVSPSLLRRFDDGNYFHSIVNRYVLEEVDITGVTDEHPTFDSAVKELEEKAKLFRMEGKKLTILPIIEIDYQGNIC